MMAEFHLTAVVSGCVRDRSLSHSYRLKQNSLPATEQLLIVEMLYLILHSHSKMFLMNSNVDTPFNKIWCTHSFICLSFITVPAKLKCFFMNLKGNKAKKLKCEAFPAAQLILLCPLTIWSRKCEFSEQNAPRESVKLSPKAFELYHKLLVDLFFTVLQF